MATASGYCGFSGGSDYHSHSDIYSRLYAVEKEIEMFKKEKENTVNEWKEFLLDR